MQFWNRFYRKTSSRLGCQDMYDYITYIKIYLFSTGRLPSVKMLNFKMGFNLYSV